MSVASTRWKAADLLIDAQRQRVERDGNEIALPPLSFRLLLALVQAAPDIVSTEQLMKQAWNGAVVNAETVSQRVKLLREALGDNYQQPCYIQSVRSRGYRLAVPVTSLDIGDDVTFQAAPQLDVPVHGPAQSAAANLPPRLPRLKLAAVLLILAAFSLVLFWYEPWRPASDPPFQDVSVAVLPFTNLSPDQENDYIALGVSEEITSLLTKFPQLRVTAPTSSRQFRDSSLPLPEIARRLQVKYLVLGSLRVNGEHIRITAQLIRAEDDTRIWSETFEGRHDDIFATQDQIAAAVVDRFRIRLPGAGPVSTPVDPLAHNLFLRALYMTQRASPEGYEQALALYEQALEREPDYAAAWEGIARVRYFQGTRGYLPEAEAFALSREAVTKALAADPDFGLGHSRLGTIAMIEGDFATAARHIQRGLELDPGNQLTLGIASMLLRNLGRLEEALEYNRAADLRDHISPGGNLNSGHCNLVAGQLETAADQFRTTLMLRPGFPTASYHLGIALLLGGDPEAALQAVTVETVEAKRLLGLAVVQFRRGKIEASNHALQELLELHRSGRAGSYDIALALAWRGEKEQALAWLERAAEEKLLNPDMQSILVEPLLRSLHNEQGWRRLMTRLGRSEDQLAAINFNPTPPEG